MDKSDTEFIITVLDVETTGTNAAHDQIIELSVKKGLDEGGFQKTWRIKPSVMISPRAFAVHGISQEDLKDCKPFSSYTALFRRIIDGSHALVGYNLVFDLGFIKAEFRRNGEPEPDFRQKLLLDPYRLWARLEPRTLADAHRRFVGSDFEGAHGAAADVQAVARVLLGMRRAFALQDKGWEDIAELCGVLTKSWIGPSNHIQWKGSEPVFGFGKHRSRSLLELKEEGSSYFSWLASSDFPEHVKEIARNAQQKSTEEFKVWLEITFGSPTPR